MILVTSLRLWRILHELIMHVQFRLILFTLLFIGIFAIEANAENGETDDSAAELERESPASLFETEIGDAEVDLFLTGSWRSRLGFDYGLIRPREGADVPGLPDGRFTARDFPGFTTRPFENIVDLTLSLRLDDRYFFETSFVDDFELDTILFGYDGREQDTLKSLLVGQGPISIPSYPFLPVAQSAGNTLGASARLETERTRHDLMARFEPTAAEISRFRGQRELAETRLDPALWIRDRRFILPDEAVTNLRVFREVGTTTADGQIDPGGRYDGPLFTDAAGHIYEEIDIDADASFSLTRGTVTLDEPAGGRIVATYSVQGAQVGDDGLGEDFLPAVQTDGRLDAEARLHANRKQFDDVVGGGGANGNSSADEAAATYLRRIGRERALRDDLENGDHQELAEAASLFFDLDSQDTGEQVPVVLLYEPGFYSPFARADAYDAGELPEDDSDLTVEYLRAGSRSEADIPIRPPARGDARGELLVLGGPEVRSVEARHPFGVQSLLYGPGARRRGEESSFEIVVEETRPRGEISLPGNVIPGTVTLTRNGVSETRFTVGSGGSVELGFEPGERDELEFRYRTFDRGAEANELVFASGNVFTIDERNTLTLALGGRWDTFADREFTEAPGEQDGTVTLSSQYDYEGERLTGFVRGAGTLSLADTTGARRVFGMEDRSVPVSLPSYRLLPGRVPDPFEFTRADGGDLTAEELEDPLSAPDRGRLLYRDYRIDGELRGVGTDLDDNRIYEYESGSLIGPYPALRDEGGERAAVFDYELEADQWVSGQIQIPPGNLPQETEGLRLRWEAVETIEGDFDGEVDVYVQFGAVGEDLDSDGILDAGSSANRPTFPFRDDSDGAGFDLRAGGVAKQRGRAATEDGTQTGTLASENPDRIASRKIASGLNGTKGRTSVEIRFSESERRKIQDGRAVRLVIVRSDNNSNNNNGTSTARGRILVSDVSILGSPLLARAVKPQTGSETVFVRTGELDVSAGEISERDARDASGSPIETPLGQAFPESVRFGTDEENRIFEVNFRKSNNDETSENGGSSNEARIELRGTGTGVHLNEYQEFVGYLHTGTAGSLEADLLYVNSGETGIAAEGIEIPDSKEWQRLGVSLSDGEITIEDSNGSRTLDMRADIDRSQEVRTLIMRVRPELESNSNDTDDTFYVDELHFSGSRPNVDMILEAGARYVYEGTLFSPTTGPSISDFELGARYRIEADVTGNTISEIGGATDTAVTIGALRFDAELEAVYSPVFDELVLAAGHGVRGPVTADALRIEDRYFREFGPPGGDRETRSTTLALRFEETAFDAESRASVSRARLRQSWRVDGAWDTPRLSASAGASQVSDRYEPPEAAYAESWIRAYSLLAPYEPEDALERRLDGAISRSAGPAVVSPTARLSGSTDSFVDTLEQNSTLNARFGIQFAPGRGNGTTAEEETGADIPDVEPPPEVTGESNENGQETGQPSTSQQQPLFRDVTVEPYYSRRLRVRDSFTDGSYPEDLSRYATVIAEEEYLYISPPVLELFERREDSVFAGTDSGRIRSEYRPAAGLQASRSFGSRLRDLIVPYRLQGEFGRTYERREDALRESRDITASASTFAVNLFGRLGAYPLTDLYASDEFFSRVSTSILFSSSNEYRTTLENEVRLFGEDGTSLELENEHRVTRADEVSRQNETSAAYTWTSDAAFAEDIPWPVEYDRARLVHEERGRLELERSTAESATERTRLTAEHSSRLELDNTLRLEASLSFGWQQETDAEGPAIDSFGVRGLLEATLRF